MKQRFKKWSITTGSTIGRNARVLITLFCFLPMLTAFRPPQQDKIQQVVAAVKEAYYSEDEDYHTDGQRVVWVKSYKNWTPGDLIILKNQAPEILKFLGQAIEHKRMDVLEQLLPNYYRLHGGVQTFAADIRRTLSNKNP